MKIKDANGNEMSVGGQGQTTLNTVLGAVGAAGALGVMGGLLGNGNRNQSQSDGDRPVTRYEMGLMMGNIQKDVEISELKTKMQQMEFNSQQLVFNATTNSVMAGLQAQIAQMQSLTKMVIPQANVVDIKTATASTQTTNTGD